MNYKVKDNYKLIFALVKRIFIYHFSDTGFTTWQLDVVLSDYKIKDNQNLAFGIQYRFWTLFDDIESNELRLTQQYNSAKRKVIVRLGSQFR